MNFREVSFEQLFAHGQDLFKRHHEEIGLHPTFDGHCVDLAINEKVLRTLDLTDALVTVAAIHTDEAAMDHLVGYALATVTRLPLANVVVGAGIVLYLAPEFRHHGAGRDLLRVIAAKLRERGVEAVHWHAKKGSPFERLLLREGSRELERIYVLKDTPSDG
jgi:GNAT superfamily N-acetyltransferase